jgi:hypothetical protein
VTNYEGVANSFNCLGTMTSSANSLATNSARNAPISGDIARCPVLRLGDWGVGFPQNWQKFSETEMVATNSNSAISESES